MMAATQIFSIIYSALCIAREYNARCTRREPHSDFVIRKSIWPRITVETATQA